MAKPFPTDTYLVNIDETETVYPAYEDNGIVNVYKAAAFSSEGIKN